ncbi:hypothetical protein J5N97_001693 [Dioscorea zingiberensis]|uniref:C3H1-type domain-containing protein n=1 Tax=Dioscorea zingiberensis TaxID=325984 RepID=A0A9D5BVW1_9LILI|nr:hypothetical protein J5N97_001693 [Dioscorea zingiberensis]
MEPLSKRPRSEFDDLGFRHAPVDGRDVGQQSFSTAGKPKPCLKFFSSLGVAPGASLSAASAASAAANQRNPASSGGDPSVTVNGYKTKLCNKFNTAEGCRFGDKCHFAHGERDLRPANNWSRGNRRPMSNGPLVGAAPPAFTNGLNPAGYPPRPMNASNFPPQGYAQPNENDNSGTYTTGPV